MEIWTKEEWYMLKAENGKTHNAQKREKKVQLSNKNVLD